MQHVAVILPACVCRFASSQKAKNWNCEICMQLKVLTAFPSPSSHAASSNQSFPRATGVLAMSRNQITETGFAQLAKKDRAFVLHAPGPQVSCAHPTCLSPAGIAVPAREAECLAGTLSLCSSVAAALMVSLSRTKMPCLGICKLAWGLQLLYASALSGLEALPSLARRNARERLHASHKS